jgi:predicted homoserine dehydrogenase-like protein
VIIVDKALERLETEGRPIRVGMVGAGFMANGITLQITNSTVGMRASAIANRHVERAANVYRAAGVDEIDEVHDLHSLDRALSSGRHCITNDPLLLCRSDNIDVVIDVTGSVDYSARVALEAIRNKKHLVLMNAELDGTLGPILKVLADRAGVVITNVDGDQPGVTFNLYRFVRGIGVRPVLCGNIKGLHDPYRNPTTQQDFARRWGQNPYMVTSFADGSKISFEQAIVANATGMSVAKRGMYGPEVPTGTSITEAAQWYPHDALGGPGIVDYVVGADPSPGVFVLGTHDDPIQQRYLQLYKLGDGPFYCFYTPYHLCHFEVPDTIARAALFQDAAIAPMGMPRVDVVAAAKVDLEAGDELDAIGGYKTYGLAENAEIVAREQLLPIGLAEGCRLKRAVSRDQVVTYDDVDIPEGRVCDTLRKEQSSHFGWSSS